MTLSHYCSNEAFLSIISNKEVWISELSLSNDFLEGKWIKNVFTKLCATKEIDTQKLKRLLDHLDSLIAFAGGAGFCLSEEDDQLGQWRGYADNGAGISIGFNPEYLESICDSTTNENFAVRLSKMTYDVTEQKKLVAKPFETVLHFAQEGGLSLPSLLDDDEAQDRKKKAQADLAKSFILFLPHLFSMKNPAFREEKEWRLLSHITRIGDGGGDISKMEFRASKDRIVPYIKLKLRDSQLPAIDQVIIGPRNLTPIEAVQAFLSKHGFHGAKVRKSEASYR